MRFSAKKRIALDGKTWWCVWDNTEKKWSTFTFFGRYDRKWKCEAAIEYHENLHQN